MVGLSIAYQIKQKKSDLSILIIEKEIDLGLHSSGRNSGVLHAGVYYKPDTLKAKVCIKGAKLLREWCENESLPVLACGKVIVPQKSDMDAQLDVLYDRGIANGTKLNFIDEKEFYNLVPDGKTSSGRALWVENTCVVKPKSIISRLKERLLELGVEILLDRSIYEYYPEKRKLFCGSTKYRIDEVEYGHLFNTSGLQADRVAKKFNIGSNLSRLTK